VPAEQTEQLDAPAAEYLPELHAPVTADRPMFAQYAPALQDTHAL